MACRIGGPRHSRSNLARSKVSRQPKLGAGYASDIFCLGEDSGADLQAYWGRLVTASVSNAFWHVCARNYLEGSVKDVGSFPGALTFK